MGVLTDDGTVWPEDQPAAQPQQPASDGGYWIPKILAGLWNSAKSGFTLPGDIATGKASMADPQTQARVSDMTGLVMGGGLAGPSDDLALNTGFRLYHGTNNFFEKPSTKFIGEGQGAQSYGWGLYGAQAEPVALDMRDQLATDPRNAVNASIQRAAVTARPMLSSEAPQAIENTLSQNRYLDDPTVRSVARTAVGGLLPDGTWTSGGLDALRQLDKLLPPPNKGHMQEWEVNADPNHFLDWDALADEQSAHVMNALQKARFWPELDEHLGGSDLYSNPTGATIYKWLTDDMDPQEASQELLSTGVPGIRTLDQFSRRATREGVPLNDPRLTRNFVIPDENMIKIVRHYNAAGVPAALAGMAVPAVQEPTQ